MIKLTSKPLEWLAWLWGFAFPMFSDRGAAAEKVIPMARWVARTVLLVIVFLLFPQALTGRTWLPLFSLCFYAFLWLSWWMYRILSLGLGAGESKLSDIDRAWAQAIESFPGPLLTRLIKWLLHVHDRFLALDRITSQPNLPTTLRRHTDISFPAKLLLSKSYYLRIQLIPAEEVLPGGEVRERPKPHRHDATMNLLVSPPARSDLAPPPVRVTISVAAENFEVDGPSRAEMAVPLEGKSAAIQFRLRGLKSGPGRVMIDFAQDGRPVGSVDLSPEVVVSERGASATAAAAGGLNLELSQESIPSAPDLVLKVFVHRFGGSAGRLQYVVSSALDELGDLPVLDGDFGTIELNTDVAAWVEDRLGALAALAYETAATPERVSGTLARVGYSLFEQLLPRHLQDLYWIIRERSVRTIMVLSDEPHIPWELIKPYRDNPATGEFEEGEFWGESYALTHWLRGRPPAQKLSFNRVCAVAPHATTTAGHAERTSRDMVPVTPLIASEAGQTADVSGGFTLSTNEELAVLRALQASGSRFHLLPARCAEFLKAFEGGEFDLIHLVAHGQFAGSSAADASAVLMDDGAFRVAELSPNMATALRRASPLIFFNSCQSGRLGFSLTRLGSWGARFVHLGCGGFVGTLWPVTDRAAVAFAGAFYKEMTAGRPIGEAMLRARKQVRESYPDDPTWLAYCCFADPRARIVDSTTTHPGASPQHV